MDLRLILMYICELQLIDHSIFQSIRKAKLSIKQRQRVIDSWDRGYEMFCLPGSRIDALLQVEDGYVVVVVVEGRLHRSRVPGENNKCLLYVQEDLTRFT